MARMLHLAAFAAIGSLLVGCVSQEKYNALKMERDGLYEQLGKAQTDASSARAEADSYKSQLAQIMSAGGNLQALVTNLTQQNADLQARYDDLNRRYAEAMGRVASGPALPPELDNALKNFAAQNPDLVDFDSARGVVKFKSDVTFAVGDAALTPKAKEVIGRFSTILNSDAASRYDLMVAGHTDNTPVSNPNTKAKGHLDNWYLSAHRAISVSKELQGQRVSPQRIAVVGYADQRPVGSNASEAGKAQNRRVEVLILPTQSAGSAVAKTPAASTNGNGARAARPQPNKDSTVGAPTGPVMNK